MRRVYVLMMICLAVAACKSWHSGQGSVAQGAVHAPLLAASLTDHASNSSKFASNFNGWGSYPELSTLMADEAHASTLLDDRISEYQDAAPTNGLGASFSSAEDSRTADVLLSVDSSVVQINVCSALLASYSELCGTFDGFDYAVYAISVKLKAVDQRPLSLTGTANAYTFVGNAKPVRVRLYGTSRGGRSVSGGVIADSDWKAALDEALDASMRAAARRLNP